MQEQNIIIEGDEEVDYEKVSKATVYLLFVLTTQVLGLMYAVDTQSRENKKDIYDPVMISILLLLGVGTVIMRYKFELNEIEYELWKKISPKTYNFFFSQKCPEEFSNEEKLARIGFTGTPPYEVMCGISLEVITDPVYLTNHPQHLFERKMLEKYLEGDNRHPVTRGSPFTKNEIVTADSAQKKKCDDFVKEKQNQYNQANQSKKGFCSCLFSKRKKNQKAIESTKDNEIQIVVHNVPN